MREERGEGGPRALNCQPLKMIDGAELAKVCLLFSPVSLMFRSVHGGREAEGLKKAAGWCDSAVL